MEPLKERGPIGPRVAENLARLRAERGISQYALADRLAHLGRPIAHSGIAKIEGGHRRVDVDDVVALAIALDVNPNVLLLPPQAGKRKVPLTEKASVSAESAWRWASGDHPLPVDLWGDPGVDLDLNRLGRFAAEAKPHEPKDQSDALQLEQEHPEALGKLRQAVLAALNEGLDPVTVRGYVDLMATLRAVAESARKKGKRRG